MSLSKNFSNNLSALRKLHNATLTEFAAKTQLSRSHLQNVLKGPCNPTLDTVEQVAERLQVDPLSLLSEPNSVGPGSGSPLLLENMREVKTHLRAILYILEEMFPEESEPPEE